jgi:cytochrome c
MIRCDLGMVVAVAAALQGGQVAAENGDWREGRQVFRPCAACHSLVEGKQLFGPSLIGVFGRQAGSLPGYPYSAAMKARGAEGLVWDEKTINEFLKGPGAYIPNTKMNFSGLPSATDRANVIAFVKRRATQ